MDITNANTEPYRKYYKFHERINEGMKVLAAVAHNGLAAEAASGKTVGKMIQAADPSWQFPPVWESDAALRTSVNGLLSGLGLVSVFSALDEFLTGVEAEQYRWKIVSDKIWTGKADSDEADRLAHVIALFADRANLSAEVLLVSYFRIVRNCIAHRDSRASPALAEMVDFAELRHAYESLSGRPEMGLPAYKVGEQITMDVKNVFFCSHLVRTIAAAVNAGLATLLGLDGLLKMATYHLLLSRNPIPGEARGSAEAILNWGLEHHYRIRVEGKEEVICHLKRIGVWSACQKAFEKRRQ